MPKQPLPSGVSLYYEWHGEPNDELPVVFIRGTGAAGNRWLPHSSGTLTRLSPLTPPLLPWLRNLAVKRKRRSNRSFSSAKNVATTTIPCVANRVRKS